MPNDDLGNFPMPPAPPVPATQDPDPITPSLDVQPPQPEPIIPISLSNTSPATPPIISTDIISEDFKKQEEPAFEETPDEIPSVPLSSASLVTEQEKLIEANESLIEKQNNQEPSQLEPLPQPEPSKPSDPPVAATLPTKTNRSAAPLIIVILLIVAGIALAAAVFLSQQTNKLKTQLEEITQTLDRQKTTITPTPSPSIFELPKPTTSTPSGSLISTPSATPTISSNIGKLLPLSLASSAIKVAINRSPNAQLILIKVDNAQDAATAVTKYFFREDTTTKKYFYVAITSKGIPEIIDKQIYVTPDDNIPSLNDAVSSNKLGIDLDEAIRMSFTQCANQAACTSSPIKAQYIKTGTGIIWQLSLYTKGISSTPLMIQINAENKAIVYKSPEFANK